MSIPTAERKSLASPDASKSNDTENNAQLQASPSFIKKTYDLHCPRKNHLDVQDGSTTTLHLAIVEVRDKPDLVLHRGPSARAPQIALSKLERSSKNFAIYLGADDSPGKDDWDVVRFVDGGFPFTTPGTKSEFHWTKTSTWTGRDFKLVDEGTGEDVAVYTDWMGMHAVGRRGRVEWLRECGGAVEALALIVLFSILERKSRIVRAVFKAISPSGGTGGVGVAAA